MTLYSSRPHKVHLDAMDFESSLPRSNGPFSDEEKDYRINKILRRRGKKSNIANASSDYAAAGAELIRMGYSPQ